MHDQDKKTSMMQRVHEYQKEGNLHRRWLWCTENQGMNFFSLGSYLSQADAIIAKYDFLAAIKNLIE